MWGLAYCYILKGGQVNISTKARMSLKGGITLNPALGLYSKLYNRYSHHFLTLLNPSNIDFYVIGEKTTGAILKIEFEDVEEHKMVCTRETLHLMGEKFREFVLMRAPFESTFCLSQLNFQICF